MLRRETILKVPFPVDRLNLFSTLIFLVCILVFIPGCTPSEAEEKIEQSRAIIEQMMEDKNVVGFAVTVIKDGDIMWSEGFGYANLETQTKVDPQTTMFRTGSVSKAITSAAAARLYEDGTLDLEADIQKYVPYFPEKEFSIMVEHLASHTSGIRHYSDDPDEYYSKKRFRSVQESLTIFQNDSLLFKPGEKWAYSSFGYNTLSAVIEGASGTTYLEYLQREVFDPLGMNHTSADFSDSIIVGRSGHYEFDTTAHKIVNTEFVDNSYKWAGGGFLSSAQDLAKFGWAWHNTEIVSDSTKKLFISPYQLSGGEETEYGLGWALYEDLVIPSYGHGGTAVGGKGTIRIFPEHNMIIGIATNNWKVGYREELDKIVKILVQNQ